MCPITLPSGFNLPALESCKALAEGAGGKESVLLGVALEHWQEAAVELTLDRHIAFKRLGAVKRHSLVNYIEGIESEGIAAEVLRHDKARPDISDKLYTQSRFGAVLLVADKAAYARDNLVVSIKSKRRVIREKGGFR